MARKRELKIRIRQSEHSPPEFVHRGELPSLTSGPIINKRILKQKIRSSTEIQQEKTEMTEREEKNLCFLCLLLLNSGCAMGTELFFKLQEDLLPVLRAGDLKRLRLPTGCW